MSRIRARRRAVGRNLLPLATAILLASQACDDQQDAADGGGGSGGVGTGATGGTSVGASAGVAGSSGSSLDGAADASTEGDADATPPPPCEPPTDPNLAAACLRLSPTPVDFDASNPEYDGSATGSVRVFATRDATSTALYEMELGSADTLDLSTAVDLPQIDGLPTTVYVQVHLYDRPDAGMWEPGFWSGGYDLTSGITSASLQAVNLPRGAGRHVRISVDPVRRLTVSIDPGAALDALGDGQGVMRVRAVAAELPFSETVFGFTTVDCTSGAAATTVELGLVGTRTVGLIVGLDDLGSGNASGYPLSVGTLTNVTPDVPTSVPRIEIPTGSYGVELATELVHVVPSAGNTPIDGLTCDGDAGFSPDATSD